MNYRYLGTEANGDLRYEITVKVFRDCGIQSPGQNDNVVNITLHRVVDNNQSGVFLATLTRNYTLRKLDFNPCIQPRPDVCYVILEYKGSITVPPTPSGYTASFQRCCRINGIVNILPPSNSLGNTYTIRLPGSSPSANFVQNSSPIFAENDTAIVCFNSSFTLDFSAVDPDGDSLTYEFTPALNGASSANPVPAISLPPPFFSLPYTQATGPANPFQTQVELNPQTGLISGVSPAQTGEYVVAVLVKEFRNGQFLAETRKELHVNVANCGLPSAELPKEIINCSNFEVTLQNQAISPAINSYFWDFGVPGDPNAQTDLVTPTYRYKDTGTYRVKLVINKGQTCTDSSFVTVKIYPGFEPGFVAEGSCFSNPFQFRDTTFSRFGTVNSWRWDFGNTAATNDTSRQRNPVYTFPAPAFYQVSLTATNSVGCQKTVTIPVEVLNRPFLQLPFKDTLICSIDTLRLLANGTGNYSWTPTVGNIIGPTTQNPLVYPKVSTKYIVSLNDRGCVATDSIVVNVLDFITVDAGRDSTICLGDSITLRAATQALSFSWSPAAMLINPTVRNPIAFPTGSKTTFTVIANLGKCQDRDSVTITTVPYPTSLASPDTTICFGDSVLLTGSGNGNRFQWLPAAGLLNPSSLSQTVFPTVTTVYSFLVFDDKGCPKPGISTVEVKVIPPIIVNAGRDTTLVIGQPFLLDASSNGSIHRWSPGLGLNQTNILNPVVTFQLQDVPPGTDFFSYRLVSTTLEGCTGFDEINIRVFSSGPSIFMPNAFTPNGDGLNDKIRPILAGVQRLDYFRVYNRYGQIVFESSNTEAGWDGTFKGLKQPSGTFVYQVMATDYLGESLKKRGTFSLLR